jgi:hypothetical protein
MDDYEVNKTKTFRGKQSISAATSLATVELRIGITAG